MGLMDWLKELFSDSEEDDDYDDEDELASYHVRSEQESFTYSSVRGDFRLCLTSSGFCAAWKDDVVARDLSGNELWRNSEMGRAMTANADGTRLAISSQAQEISLVDSATGTVQRTVDTGHYIDWLLWNAEGQIIAASSEVVCVYDEELTLLKCYEESELGTDYIGGLAFCDKGSQRVILADSNNRQLVSLDITSGEVNERVDFRPAEAICQSRDSSLILSFGHSSRMHFAPTSDLKAQTLVELESPEGVACPNAGASPDDDFYERFTVTAWAPLPDMSPDNSKLLVNDMSGQLWLLAIPSGEVIHQFPRDVIDAVYDVLWIDDSSFLALLNNRRVVKMAVDGTGFDFDESDEAS